MQPSRFTVLALAALAAACGDAATVPTTRPIGGTAAFGVAPQVVVDMSNYVAIGTSVSMGWFDDGVVGSSQAVSWTAQLADKVGVPFSVPRIAEPGCPPPRIPPLVIHSRVDGTSGNPSTVCAPNEAGVTLPTHNLAVENATAAEALNATPETATQGRGPVTSRVLPPGMTQITAMRSLNPTFVSVELGGNELLPAQVGLLFPNVTFTPFAQFRANYAQIIDNVKATGAKAVLVSIRVDMRKFPTIRTAAEIASQREAFRAYNVSVNANCDASENYIFVRGKVITAVLTGLARQRFGLGPFDLSCVDVPGTPDFVLTPADMQFINALADQMSDEIERHATENGYAVFPLGVLYNKSKEDVPFELNTYLRSDAPYGKWISLDGVHPNAAGHSVLARAARVAIQQTYGTAQ
jgi:lysophospholipase L1-like esterase